MTLCVFPGVLTRWVPGPDSGFQHSRQLFGTLLVGTFQVADVMSRAAASAMRRVRPRGLRAVVLLRLLFVPLFMLGQRRPAASPLWGSDAGRFLLSFALAFTNGLCASCGMMLGTERAAPERREVAGGLLSCAMVLGIFGGSLMAFLTQL